MCAKIRTSCVRKSADHNKNHLTRTIELEPVKEALRAFPVVFNVDQRSTKEGYLMNNKGKEIDPDIVNIDISYSEPTPARDPSATTTVVPTTQDRIGSIKAALDPMATMELYQKTNQERISSRQANSKKSRGVGQRAGNKIAQNEAYKNVAHKASKIPKAQKTNPVLDTDRSTTSQDIEAAELLRDRVVSSTALEKYWTAKFRDKYKGLDYALVRWDFKDKKMAREMVNTYGQNTMERAVDYVFSNWDKLRAKHEFYRLGPVENIVKLYSIRKELLRDVEFEIKEERDSLTKAVKSESKSEQEENLVITPKKKDFFF